MMTYMMYIDNEYNLIKIIEKPFFDVFFCRSRFLYYILM